jgi:hypothetical protein
MTQIASPFALAVRRNATLSILPVGSSGTATHQRRLQTIKGLRSVKIRN